MMIYMKYHHPHVARLARIFMTLSLSRRSSRSSIAYGRSSWLYPYRAVVNKFLSVVRHLHVRVKGSISERWLWVRFYFSISVRHIYIYIYIYIYMCVCVCVCVCSRMIALSYMKLFLPMNIYKYQHLIFK